MREQELNKYWKTVVNTIQDGIMIVDTVFSEKISSIGSMSYRSMYHRYGNGWVISSCWPNLFFAACS